MIMAAKALFQYLLISLILLWPLWAIGLAFSRWLLIRTGLIPKRLVTVISATRQRKGGPKPVDIMMLGTSPNIPQGLK
jgi:hypothetical protein